MVSSDRLKPGETGQIRATVDTAGRSGAMSKYITVYSNDPVTPILTLSLTFTITQKP